MKNGVMGKKARIQFLANFNIMWRRGKEYEKNCRNELWGINWRTKKFGKVYNKIYEQIRKRGVE